MDQTWRPNIKPLQKQIISDWRRCFSNVTRPCEKKKKDGIDFKMVNKLPLFHPRRWTFKLASGFVSEQKRTFVVVVCLQWSDQILIQHSASLISVYHRLCWMKYCSPHQQQLPNNERLCRSVLDALWILGSLSVPRHRTCVHNHVQQRHGGVLSSGRSFTLIHLHTHVQVPQCSWGQKCNHRQWTDTVFVIVFPIAQIYFSCVLSLHFMAQKPLHWVKSAAWLVFCLCTILKVE